MQTHKLKEIYSILISVTDGEFFTTLNQHVENLNVDQRPNLFNNILAKLVLRQEYIKNFLSRCMNAFLQIWL